jgi:hypothetical protein
MATIGLILMVAAFILFLLSAIGVPTPPRFSLIAGGLACWTLAIILGGLKM